MAGFGRLTALVATTATVLLSAVWVPSAGAVTQTLGQIAPTPVPGGGCTNCTNFQQSTDTAAGSPSYVVPAGSWTITSWSALAGTMGGEAQLRVFRAGPGAGEFTLVAQSALETFLPSTSGPFSTSISVQGGDLLGIRTGNASADMRPGYVTANSGDVALSVLTGPTNIVIGDTACGSGSTFSCSTLPTTRANVSATLFQPDLSPPPGTPSPSGTCSGRPATITGTAGAETMTGTGAADVIAALGGNDTIRGLAGKDVICGGTGKDRLFGGGGGDILIGGAAKDSLFGGPGKDILNPKGGQGGGPKDTCSGGPGKDQGACGNG